MTALVTPETPFQEGQAAFSMGIGRYYNPYMAPGRPAKELEWNAGFDYGFSEAVVQPENNTYTPEVYAELLALANSFESRQYISAAEELKRMAARGPEQHKGFEHISTRDVLKVASERLAEMSRMSGTN